MNMKSACLVASCGSFACLLLLLPSFASPSPQVSSQFKSSALSVAMSLSQGAVAGPGTVRAQTQGTLLDVGNENAGGSTGNYKALTIVNIGDVPVQITRTGTGGQSFTVQPGTCIARIVHVDPTSTIIWSFLTGGSDPCFVWVARHSVP